MNKAGTFDNKTYSASGRARSKDRRHQSSKDSFMPRSLGNPTAPYPEDEVMETMSARLRKKLAKVPKGDSARQRMHDMLDDSASIEGDIKEVHLEDGPQVRKYLERYAEHVKRNDWK